MNSRTMANGAGLLRDSKPLPSVPSQPGFGPYAPQQNGAAVPRRMSTIRVVDGRGRPSFDGEGSPSGSSPPPVHANSLSVSFTNGNAATAALPVGSQLQQNGVRNTSLKLKRDAPATDSDLPTPPLSDTPPRVTSPGPALASAVGLPNADRSPPARERRAVRASTGGAPPVEAPQPEQRHRDEAQQGSMGATESGPPPGGWDSTVGKAGLGKTGRVINRLVSDNEALKRDLKIERLKAEEARQAARLLEDRMERLVSDYEGRLLEASVAKTLLSRKERQVESLQTSLDLERKRTTEAQDRERTWRQEVERVRSDTKRQVDDATSHAALMEGRYNAISGHWRDQGEEVKRALARTRKEMQLLLEERQEDDDKITVLRDLCDQQDGNIRDLRLQKEDISRKFEEYKEEQETALEDIKSNATEREAQQERTLEETREVLDKLKWVLNVKNNIGWAQ